MDRSLCRTGFSRNLIQCNLVHLMRHKSCRGFQGKLTMNKYFTCGVVNHCNTIKVK
uniref:Uncharacterized protein n=1 Tax=Octopus bimaculoides TaxID=37653 RepID=A0A0L8GFC4_OCTBM